MDVRQHATPEHDEPVSVSGHTAAQMLAEESEPSTLWGMSCATTLPPNAKKELRELDTLRGPVAFGTDQEMLSSEAFDRRTSVWMRTVPSGKEMPSTSTSRPPSPKKSLCWWCVRSKPSWEQRRPTPNG
nr:unnamed protein product [Digitaria exilis]